MIVIARLFAKHLKNVYRNKTNSGITGNIQW